MSDLFEPITVGGLPLQNRIAMAPMTRSRASADGVPSPLAAEYYAQRASAGLIITEATTVSQQGSGYPNIPGAYTEAQMAGWRDVVKAVHAKGGKIMLQLFHMGRIGHSSLMGQQPVAPSAIVPTGQVMNAEYKMVNYETPRELDALEIPSIIEDFAESAVRAIKAGFDGVQIHAANGYLLDQFLRDGSNQRTDVYGSNLDDRTRMLYETVSAVTHAIGAERTSVRLSPLNSFNGMQDSDPLKTFTRMAERLNDFELAFLEIMESNMGGDNSQMPAIRTSIRKVYKGNLMLNGGYTAESGAAALAANQADIISYGVPYIANPDLVERFKAGSALNEGDRSTYYSGGEKGYTDYQVMQKKAA